MTRLPVFLSLAALLAAACGPRAAELRQSVRDSGHSRVAVLPFAPGDPESARETTEAFVRELESLGFEILPLPAAATPDTSREAMLSAARAAGAQGAVAGSILELSEKMVVHPDEFEQRVRTFSDPQGRQQPLVERILIRPGHVEFVPVFRGSAILLDAATGKVLAQVSTWKETAGSPLDAARAGARDLARRLAVALRRQAPGAGR